jgi:hypothetical protein
MKSLIFVILALCLPLHAQTINPSQIRPSATNGQVVTTVGGKTQWSDSALPPGAITSVTATPPLDCTTTGSSVNCSMAQATSLVDGYLSHNDWTAFNGKQAALGFTPYNATNPSGFISGITSSNVTTALGYTPYNSTNPSGYISGNQSITLGGILSGSGATSITAAAASGYYMPSTTDQSNWNGKISSTGLSGWTVGQLPIAASGSTSTSSIAYATANTASTIVERDGSDNFSAGTITAALTGNSSTATNLSTNGTANQVWGMNSGATAQGWQTPGSTMTYPGANTIGVANSGNTAWRTPLFSDITGLFGSGSCSGLLKSDGTCVLASTLNVNSALTASNVQCYLQDTCPNDAIWQAPWLTASQPSLAVGYPLGASDTTMTLVTLAGMPATGHVVTTHSEEMGYSYVSSSGGNSTYNITRAKHGTTASAISVSIGNMAGVVSETAACSTCGVLMQTVNVGGTAFGGQTNAGLEPSVGGNYAVFNAITMPTLNTHGGEFLEASPTSNGAVIPSGYGAVSFDASGAAAARAAVGNCSAGQYGTATTTSGLTCAQVAYSQISGTPSIPTVGTWGALNYPTWASGSPFVKMTGLGTFSLDTNTYLTSSAIASTTNLLSGNGSGNAVSSGIAASNVPLLNAANTFTATNTFNNATYSALFTGGPVGIGTTAPTALLTTYQTGIYDSGTQRFIDFTGDSFGTNPATTSNAGALTAIRLGNTNNGKYAMVGAVSEDSLGYSRTTGLSFWTATQDAAPLERMRISGNGNVSIGDTTATSMFNVGTANQFQVTSTGVSSAGAGSTDLNGSGVPEAHCLADGTGGGACGGHNANATQTTVSCSTAGTATFSEPFTGASYKKVIYSVSGCQGTVSYTFPVAFTTGTVQLSQAGGANTVTNTSITWGSVSALTAIGVIEGW